MDPNPRVQLDRTYSFPPDEESDDHQAAFS